MTKGSPFTRLSRHQWRLNAQFDMLEGLDKQGLDDSVGIQEIQDIYWPLATLLSRYYRSRQILTETLCQTMGRVKQHTPYLVGVSGGVAAGKSTTAEILKQLLSRWPEHRHVDVVSSDSFLMSESALEAKGLSALKGFPDSFDLNQLTAFLWRLKSGARALKIPVYSHYTYDLTDYYQVIDQPDILIVEGVNILQPLSADNKPGVLISDYFDVTVFINAPIEAMKTWFMNRFFKLRAQAADDPEAFFYQFARLSKDEALARAEHCWEQINLPNFEHHILPYRERAHFILTKAMGHEVSSIDLKI